MLYWKPAFSVFQDHLWIYDQRGPLELCNLDLISSTKLLHHEWLKLLVMKLTPGWVALSPYRLIVQLSTSMFCWRKSIYTIQYIILFSLVFFVACCFSFGVGLLPRTCSRSGPGSNPLETKQNRSPAKHKNPQKVMKNCSFPDLQWPVQTHSTSSYLSRTPTVKRDHSKSPFPHTFPDRITQHHTVHEDAHRFTNERHSSPVWSCIFGWIVRLRKNIIKKHPNKHHVVHNVA